MMVFPFDALGVGYVDKCDLHASRKFVVVFKKNHLTSISDVQSSEVFPFLWRASGNTGNLAMLAGRFVLCTVFFQSCIRNQDKTISKIHRAQNQDISKETCRFL